MGSSEDHSLHLQDGSRVGVVGGGPAGSFFSYFLLQMTRRIGLEVAVDIYEPRDFSIPGPQGCNMCGGIISESLVQNLAVEGINLAPPVVQRGIDSYVLHMDVGSVRIETPLQEKRIAAVHRGCGPRGIQEVEDSSFDHHLIKLALEQGARHVHSRVSAISWEEGQPRVKTPTMEEQTYDLLAVAVGVNSGALKLLEGLGLAYKPPTSTKTHIRELGLGHETIKKYLGSSMHVFLLNIPRLEFAALIPKGDYVTLCLLGEDIDKPMLEAFLKSREVRQCLPPNYQPPPDFCHCGPRISVNGAVQPFADRIVFVGDCGVTRLYKDGIGAAYRTSKAAAKAAVFGGLRREDFQRHYWPACQTLHSDNRVGKLIFEVTRQIQKREFARRGVWRMVSREQVKGNAARRMSTVLWDTFTGSAPYREVFLRTLNPLFMLRFSWELLVGLLSPNRNRV